MHPGVPFPTPEEYPHMYSKGSSFDTYTNEIDVNNRECTDTRYCPKGLIDYECQLKYSCYFNLINLGLHAFGFLIVGMFLIGAFTKLFIFLGKISGKFAFVLKFVLCFGSCLKSISFGALGDEIYYKEEIDPQRKVTKEQK